METAFSAGGNSAKLAEVSERGDDLELLGLAAGEPVTHDQVRRAYLRRLRLHPPERDPEGFRRLREAFERMEPWARLQDLVRVAKARRDAAGGGGREGAGADELDAAGEVERRAAGAAGEVERGAAGAAEREDAQPTEREGAGGVLEDAAAPASRPGGRGRAGSAERRERPGEANGVPGELPPAIVVKLGHWGRIAAQPVVEEAEVDAPETLSAVIEEVLALLDSGKLDAARDLAEQWNRSALDDHREVSPVDAQRWALTRELVDMSRRLPDSMRRAIIRGIQRDDLAIAYAATESYQTRYPVEANELAHDLAKRAPNLHTSLGVLLRSRAQNDQTGGRSGASPFRLVWLAVVLLSALARAAGSCDGGRDRLRDLQREAVPVLPLTPDSQRWRELPPSDPLRPEVHPQPGRWYDRHVDPPVDLYGHPPTVDRATIEKLVAPDGEKPPSAR